MNVSSTKEGVTITVLTLMVVSTVPAMMDTFWKKTIPAVLVCICAAWLKKYTDTVSFYIKTLMNAKLIMVDAHKLVTILLDPITAPAGVAIK